MKRSRLLILAIMLLFVCPAVVKAETKNVNNIGGIPLNETK